MASSTRTTWHLARLAECADPDSPDGIGFAIAADRELVGSPGADFLRSVEGSALELAEELRETTDEDRTGSYVDRADSSGRLHELADSEVPVYTFDRWRVFTDLGAWDEDASELGGTADDLTAAAGIALYMIAERLARAILEQEEDAAPDDEESEEEDDA